MMKQLLLALLLAISGVFAHAADTIEVWKDPDCGCCTKWVDHLQAAGFKVRTHQVDDMNKARARNGVPPALGACHTARVGVYAIEGHVPAADIKRLLRERPKAAGLAVPGMPLGSPGMDADRTQPYDVLLFTAEGRTRVYRHYPSKDER
jgi:hypothetical protein